MGKRSAVVELFLGDMGSIQRELRPSTQREDQLTMETKLEQIAVKAVNQLPKSVVREIRTPRSVGTGGGRPPPVTRWDGKRGVGHRPQATAPILDSTNSVICPRSTEAAAELVLEAGTWQETNEFNFARAKCKCSNYVRFLQPLSRCSLSRR
jgi:hypothetical protein